MEESNHDVTQVLWTMIDDTQKYMTYKRASTVTDCLSLLKTKPKSEGPWIKKWNSQVSFALKNDTKTVQPERGIITNYYNIVKLTNI